MVVSEEEVRGEAIEQKGLRKEDLPEWKQFAHLSGKPIGIGEAARKYKLLCPTVSMWVSRGLIKKIGQKGQKVLIDEQDIAYCEFIYRLYGGKHGKWLFSRGGIPYQKGKTVPLNRQLIESE